MSAPGLSRVSSLALLGAALAAPRALPAQALLSLTATATVDNTALSAQTAQSLAFGTVIPGSPMTVVPNSAASGMIRIQGAKKAQIIVTFTLPTTLTAGSGPYTMPISFGTTSACALPVFPVGSVCSTFNPNASYTGQIPNKAAPQNEVDIYLGGTVSPAAGQRGGVYTGTIVMTVIY